MTIEQTEIRGEATFLARERQTLESLLPGLDEQLAAVPLAELESPDTPAIGLFRAAGAPALVIPEEDGGLGVGALEAVRVQRAIGSRCPSLAVATTMHHFSIASLVEMSELSGGFEWMLLEAISEEKQLVASGFAEGKSGQGVFTPAMRARRTEDGGLLVSGAKKPCSLSRSMDLLTLSVGVDSTEDGVEEFAVAVVPADSPGIEIQPFWAAPVLTGAESDAVVLKDVEVDPALVISSGAVGDTKLDEVQANSFLWFELLITASYIGMGSALVERVLAGERGDPTSRAGLVIELEAAMMAVERVALQMADGTKGLATLTQALASRYAAQDAITRCVAGAVELLGGMSFIGGQDVSYLAAASRALAFHPPARSRTAESMVRAFAGEELEIA